MATISSRFGVLPFGEAQFGAPENTATMLCSAKYTGSFTVVSKYTGSPLVNTEKYTGAFLVVEKYTG